MTRSAPSYARACGAAALLPTAGDSAAVGTLGAGVPVEKVDRVRRLEEAFLELVSAPGGTGPGAAENGGQS